VTVKTVAPGVTPTAITAPAFNAANASRRRRRVRPLDNRLGRVSEPEDVANLIAFVCLPARRQVTGQVIHAGAGAVVGAG